MQETGLMRAEPVLKVASGRSDEAAAEPKF